jgi:hypothetical protein
MEDILNFLVKHRRTTTFLIFKKKLSEYMPLFPGKPITKSWRIYADRSRLGHVGEILNFPAKKPVWKGCIVRCYSQIKRLLRWTMHFLAQRQYKRGTQGRNLKGV